MLAKRLRELRNEKGKKQHEVADYLGITRPAYTAYESGNRQPDLATVTKLAEFFSVTTDYLLGKSNEPNPTVTPDSSVVKDAPLAFYGNAEGLNIQELEKIINRAVKKALGEREREKQQQE